MGTDALANLTISNIMAGLIFGIIGFAAFRYGKKEGTFKPLITGIILMVYPYFVTNTIALYAIGILLTLSLFFFNG